MIEFNINDHVWVRLTPFGVEQLKRQHDELNNSCRGLLGEFKEPARDKDGFSRFQMWSLMESLGGEISMLNNLPFETNIRIETKP